MSPALGLGALGAITVVWGSTFVIVKDALDTIPPSLLLAVRFTLAALALSWTGIDRRAVVPALWLGLLAFADFATQTVGLGITSASNAAFITGLSVVLTPVVAAVFWRRPLARRDYVAAGVGFVGLAVIATRDGLSAVNAGDLLILLTAVSYALFIVYLGEVGGRVNANSLAFMQHLPMLALAWLWAAPVVSLSRSSPWSPPPASRSCRCTPSASCRRTWPRWCSGSSPSSPRCSPTCCSGSSSAGAGPWAARCWWRRSSTARWGRRGPATKRPARPLR